MKAFLTIVFAVGLVAAGLPVMAEEAPRLLWGSSRQLGVGSVLEENASFDPNANTSATGQALSSLDTLRGSGSPVGYVLRHGNVIAKTLTVSVNGRQLVRNKDFFIDPVSGGLSFAVPIERGETIRANYQYIDGPVAGRSFAGLPLLPGLFGGSSTANFLHAYRGADPSAGIPFDVLTFGMKMNWDIGSAGFESLYYLSDPRKGSTVASMFEKQISTGQAAPVSDHMMVQKMNLDMGGSRIQLGYQDIGANFTGFTTLREQAAMAPDVLNQYEKEKGIRRYSMALELKPSRLLPAGSPWDRLSWQRIYDGKGGVTSFQLSYTTPSVGVTGAVRTVDPGFARMASLSAAELSDMALITRRQFDPNATLGQVTDADRLAVTREAGISRNVLSTYFQMTPSLRGTLSFLSIKDRAGHISSQTFSLNSKNWQGWITNQTISPTIGCLPLLAPVEVARFGNEYAMNRTGAGFTAALGPMTSLTGDYSIVKSNEGGVVRSSLGFAAKNYNIKFNYQNIDPTFQRINDLADPLKAQMLGDRGFKKWDASFGGQLSKALRLDSAFMRAKNKTESLSRTSDVLNLLYAPNDATKVVFQHNHALNRSAADIMSGAIHDVRSIEHRFKNNWFVAFSTDTNLTQAAGGAQAGTVTEVRRFETDKSRPAWISFDQRLLDYTTGAFEHATNFNIQAMAGKSLTLIGAHSSIDRGVNPSETVNKVGVRWAAPKSLNVGLDLIQKSTNYAGEGTGYMASLGGPIASRIGPFTNLTATVEYGSTRLNQGFLTYNRGVKLDWMWGKHVMGYEFSHIRTPDGRCPMARGYRFKSDPDPNKWYHIDLYIKDKDATGLGQLQAIRNINADVRLSPTTQLSYTVNRYKELPNGLFELTVSRSTKLTTRVARDLNVIYDYRRDENRTALTNTLKYSIGLQRIAKGGMTVDVFLGVDKALTPSGAVNGRSLRVRVDHQVGQDRYFSLTGEAIRWNNTNPAIPNRNDVEARLDYRMPFSW